MATIDCIGRDGIQSLTTRKIAKEAGVNSAAINYYFGSKEKLVEKALNQTLNEMSTLPEEILDLKSLDSKERLKMFFLAIMEKHLIYFFILFLFLYLPVRILIISVNGDREAKDTKNKSDKIGILQFVMQFCSGIAVVIFYHMVLINHYKVPLVSKTLLFALLLIPIILIIFELIIYQKG